MTKGTTVRSAGLADPEKCFADFDTVVVSVNYATKKGRVAAMMETHRGASVKEMAAELGISETAVRSLNYDLRVMGYKYRCDQVLHASPLPRDRRRR